MNRRAVEIFVAGCPCCEETVQLVKSLACESCDVHVLDMRVDETAKTKAKDYGVRRVPTVAVNGVLAECCQGGVDAAMLRAAGIGIPLD